MKKYLFIILALLLGITGYSQTVSFTLAEAPSLWEGYNQMGNAGFDLYGNNLSKGKSHFNSMGRGIQTLNWDIITNENWVTQTLYDRHGRGALQTLSAPVSGGMAYKSNFITNNTGVSYNTNDFDLGVTIGDPHPVNPNSELGSYYSTNNTFNEYQDVTQYPFTRTVFSKLNPGSRQRALGGNKIGSEWKQTYNFTMPIGDVYGGCGDAGDAFYNSGKRVMKTVSRDVHGEDIVVFTDTDGNTLGAARSGGMNHSICRLDFFIGVQGYVDIHIPKLVNSFDLSDIDISISGNLTVYNLITEEIETITNSNGTVNIDDGFYRISVEHPLEYAAALEDEIAPLSPVKVHHRVSYYDYSRNYYDQVGRLKNSKQPLAGWLESTFEYNSLGQLLSSTSTDEGSIEFLYRKDGLIRFSQNSKQHSDEEFSYTNYDDVDRPIESGVVNEKESGLYFSNMAAHVDNSNILNNAITKEVHTTMYDVPDPELYSLFTTKDCNLVAVDYKQTFMAGNVVKTSTEDPKTATTWYSYDVFGRTRWMIQKLAGMSCYKTIEYSYDPGTGQATMVEYQKQDADERFVHKYTYNEAGQLTEVHTSRDGLNFEEQARYSYSESGELARTVLAENLQGIDYVYSINGRLKAVNHPSLQTANDPGGDGGINGIPTDVFGFAIDYYNGDYTRTGTPTPVAQENTNGTDQYNGNIKGLRFKTEGFSPLGGEFQSYMYQYNKNNWLQSATYGSGSLSASGGGYSVNFSANTNDDYKVSNLQYDANGNIKTLKRNGFTSGTGNNDMDNFTYDYFGNRLKSITDTGDNNDPDRFDDLKDQSNNGQDNYIYNELGQLTTDVSGKAFYEYNTAGLVTRISTFGDGTTNSVETYFEENFSTATNSETYLWNFFSSGSAAINFSGEYLPTGSVVSCGTLDNKYQESLILTMGNNKKVRRVYDVIPGVENTLSLDVIVNQWGLGQLPAGYTIRIIDGAHPTWTTLGSLLTSISFNTNLDFIDDPDLSGTICDKYYDNKETLIFTPTSDKITFQIKKVTTGGTQPMYLDNISLSSETVPLMDIAYDDRGQRVQKKVYDKENAKTYYTYYVRDVSGAIMGVYNRTQSLSTTPGGSPSTDLQIDPTLKELPVYGASRLGVLYVTPPSGGTKPGPQVPQDYYRYQLTDHLGNVRAVIGKNSNGDPFVVAKTDYYPFGMPMPDRNVEGNYRFAYQGQEKDRETGMEAFQLRLWDARIGRWLTTDPRNFHFSPYLGMANNPIKSTDPDGGSPCPPDCGEGGAPGASQLESVNPTGGIPIQQLDEVVIIATGFSGTFEVGSGAIFEQVTPNTLVVKENVLDPGKYAFNLPRDFGFGGGPGSDGLYYYRCAGCHNPKGAFRYAAYNSQERFNGIAIAATFDVLLPFILPPTAGSAASRLDDGVYSGVFNAKNGKSYLAASWEGLASEMPAGAVPRRAGHGILRNRAGLSNELEVYGFTIEVKAGNVKIISTNSRSVNLRLHGNTNAADDVLDQITVSLKQQ